MIPYVDVCVCKCVCVGVFLKKNMWINTDLEFRLFGQRQID